MSTTTTVDKLLLNSFVINLSSLSIYRQVTQDAAADDDYDRDSSLLPSLHCTAMLFRHWYCSILQDLHVPHN